MPFEEGKSGNPNGRPKGAKGKKTQQWEQFAEWMMNEGMSKFQDELDKLEGKQYIEAVQNMIEYFQPKLSRTEISGDKDNPLVLKFYLKDEDQKDILDNL